MSETDSTADSSGTDLAEEIADWTPPWQRGQRSDMAPDEPVEPDPPRVVTPEPEPTPQPAAAETVEPLPIAADLAGTLEAILMVCEEPVSETNLAQALGRPETEIVDTRGACRPNTPETVAASTCVAKPAAGASIRERRSPPTSSVSSWKASRSG